MIDAGTSAPSGIHPTAVIDASVQLGEDVTVGPYCVLGPNVVLHDGVALGAHVIIERNTSVGRECRVASGAILGGDPQDLKYAGEPTELVIGERTHVREFVTLNRGTAAHGRTQIGDDCLIMAYAHVAHDCMIGDRVVIANAVNMGGHVEIGDWVVVGGMCAIHQFAKIGAHAFIGGTSAVRKDVPPYVKASGSPLKLYGLNSIGLQRRGISEAARRELRRAYRLLFQSKLNLNDALEGARTELEPYPEVLMLLDFCAQSGRGVTV
ncbi:MAG TPA: acyl-ACP--UDP-N-acetylglucosamine O-acyltransferase [Longimicrobiales bacterium]|nr:acyl-ACP--UDP-N-acetylglucosamine O-acyltransferase [Longimicrobiales bacterium]